MTNESEERAQRHSPEHRKGSHTKLTHGLTHTKKYATSTGGPPIIPHFHPPANAHPRAAKLIRK
jgi:hypothetical protein